VKTCENHSSAIDLAVVGSSDADEIPSLVTRTAIRFLAIPTAQSFWSVTKSEAVLSRPQVRSVRLGYLDTSGSIADLSEAMMSTSSGEVGGCAGQCHFARCRRVLSPAVANICDTRQFMNLWDIDLAA
jgi:hypothetical protein